MERMTMDIDQLNKQYKRLRERQKQAHIILAGKTLNLPLNSYTAP
jgi:hypothetical protein